MRRTARRWMGGACGLMVAAAMLSTPALAATSTVIEVFPGPSAIKNALQQANPGDTLNIATGFSDAGIYIGGIVDTGTGSLITQGNTLYENNRGIIVEDSAGVSLIVRRNLLHANANDGLFLHNSDGIVITSNTASDNGYAGIELDPNSDGNLVKGNRSRGHPYDLANGGGTGNCFRDNVYTTSFGSIA